MSKAKEPETHFCHGYTDEHGIWNNGFYCPKWGDPGERYCCSDEKAHFCCPPPTPSTRLLLPPLHSHDTTTASAGAPRSAAIPMVAIIAGALTGVFFLILCFIICFAVCRCLRRKRRTNKDDSHRKYGVADSIERDSMGRCDQSMMGRCEQQGSMGRCSEQGNMGGRYEQGSMGRCEQGSMGRCGERMDASRMSVACASVGGGSASDYLHCGCTPGNHHHPHIDVTDMTRLQDTLDWPPEFDQVVRLRFDDPPPYHPDTRAASPASDVSKLSVLSSENKHKRIQPDLLCMSSFRPGAMHSSPVNLHSSPVNLPMTALASITRADLERCGISGLPSLGLTRADLERVADLERCKRDSGVLSEDTDATSDDNSTVTMLSNIHQQHFSHLRLVPPPPVSAILRPMTTNSPRSLDGSSSPCGTNSS